MTNVPPLHASRTCVFPARRTLEPHLPGRTHWPASVVEPSFSSEVRLPRKRRTSPRTRWLTRSVVMPVYGYYHFSGAKTAVNTVRQMSQTAESLKNKAVEATPSVKSMMHFLRQAAYSYTG